MTDMKSTAVILQEHLTSGSIKVKMGRIQACIFFQLVATIGRMSIVVG